MKTSTTLNDLKYEWPAGFARFIIDARNPNVDDIDGRDMESLESILGIQLKTIRAHY
jgi:hypothetical protein